MGIIHFQVHIIVCYLKLTLWNLTLIDCYFHIKVYQMIEHFWKLHNCLDHLRMVFHEPCLFDGKNHKNFFGNQIYFFMIIILFQWHKNCHHWIKFVVLYEIHHIILSYQDFFSKNSLPIQGFLESYHFCIFSLQN